MNRCSFKNRPFKYRVGLLEAKTEIPAYMSHPKETAKLIEEAATSAHANQ